MVTTIRALLPFSGRPPRSLARRKREARPKDLLQELLEDRWQGPQPKRIDGTQVIRCADRLLRRSERVRQLSGFELLFRAQPRKGKSGDIDTRYRMTGLLRAMRISIRQSVAEMAPGRIRMALNDHHTRHLADNSPMRC